MRNIFLFAVLILIPAIAAAQNKHAATLDAEQADADFAVQGEYSGALSIDGEDVSFGLQVIADGGGRFRSAGYFGGLPGDGWDGNRELKIPGSGKVEDGVCVLYADSGEGRAEISNGAATVFAGNQQLGQLKRVTRKSPTLGAEPPQGAVVLFDGTTAEHFTNGQMDDRNLLKQGVTLSLIHI